MSSNLGRLNLRSLWELQMEMQCSNCYIVLTLKREIRAGDLFGESTEI